MKQKPKFTPKITRVKLNPEQAVLACSCYTSGFIHAVWAFGTVGPGCLEPSEFKLSGGSCLFSFSSGSS